MELKMSEFLILMDCLGQSLSWKDEFQNYYQYHKETRRKLWKELHDRMDKNEEEADGKDNKALDDQHSADHGATDSSQSGT